MSLAQKFERKPKKKKIQMKFINKKPHDVSYIDKFDKEKELEDLEEALEDEEEDLEEFLEILDEIYGMDIIYHEVLFRALESEGTISEKQKRLEEVLIELDAVKEKLEGFKWKEKEIRIF